MNINKKSPKFKLTSDLIKPVFRSTYEQEKWWDKQKTYWRDGYGDGHSHLCGMHIFYLTQGHIKVGTEGKIQRPDYRDCDEWIIEPLHDAFWHGGTIGLIKRREIGATSIGAGLLPLYTMRMFESSTFGMTSCDKDRIFKAFTDKTLTFLQNIDSDIAPSILNKDQTKNSVYLRLGWKVKRDEIIKIDESDFFTKETSERPDSPKGFSATRMKAAFFDEFPLHKRKEDLLNSSESCFMESGKQTGLLFWGGTVELMPTEDMASVNKMIKTQTELGMKIIFAPAWWGMHMVNGVSNEQSGIEEILKKREALSKLEDKTKLNAYIKNYPLTWEEVFDLAEGAKFEEDVQEKIKIQIRSVRSQNIPIMKCRLVETGGIIQTVDSKNPNIYIIEHPQQGIDYIMGIDGVATGIDSGEEKGSDVAAVISTLFHPNGNSYSVPAIYTERPKNVESSYINIVALARYYNKFGGLKWIDAEGSVGTTDHFSTFLQKEGMIKYAMHRKDLSGKGNINTNKLFQPRDIAMKDWQFRWANYFLRKHIDKIKMLPLLENMLLTGNADILDAWLMCGIILGMNFDKPIVKKEPPKRQRLEYYREGFFTKTRWVSL